MMEVLSKTNNTILAFILALGFTCNVYSQCCGDCNLIKVDELLSISRCDKFYNFFEGQVDSSAYIIGEYLDTVLGITLPIIKNAIITTLYEQNRIGSDTQSILLLKNGVPFIRGTLVKGLAEGDFWGDFNGDSYTAQFSKGLLNGKKTKVDQHGDNFVENYKDGILEGATYTLYKNGQYKYYCNYSNNVKQGPEFSMFEDGKLEAYMYFINGLPEDGTYRSFNGDGNVVETLIIKGGKVIYRKLEE